MSATQKIAEKYSRLIAQEDATRSELAAAEARLQTVDQEDIAAGAQAALDGKPLPTRKAIKLKHAVENLQIDLKRLDEAIYLLQLEARAAVGEGRDFPVFIPEGVPATRAEVVAQMKEKRTRDEGESEEHFEARLASQIPRGNKDAESIINEAARQREISLDRRLPRLTERPSDLVAWIESAYDAEDRQAESDYEAKAKRDRGRAAVEAVNRAKAEHLRRGLPGGSFSIHSYPDIILPEHLAEFEPAIERSPFQKAREERLPSHEEAQNVPVAEPQPVVNEAEALRRREIAGVRPPAAADVEPVTPEAQIAARIAEQEAATAHLEVPPSQTPIVEEAA
jgi:hypothetical protein